MKCFNCKVNDSRTSVDMFGITITCNSCGHKVYKRYLLADISTMTETVNCKYEFEFGVELTSKQWDEINAYCEKNK